MIHNYNRQFLTLNFNTMKTYIQFKTLSTGYIHGTIPPQFSDDHKKPIDCIGSDSVYNLDRRLNLESMINKGFEVWNKHINKSSIIGFDIMKGESYSHSRSIYSYIKN